MGVLRLLFRSAVHPGDVVHQIVALLVHGDDALRLRGKDDAFDVLGLDARLLDHRLGGDAHRLPIVVGILLHMGGSGIECRIGFRHGSDDVAVEVDQHSLVRAGADVMRNDVLHMSPLRLFMPAALRAGNRAKKSVMHIYAYILYKKTV